MTRSPRPLPAPLLLVLEPAAATPARLEPLLLAGARWFWLRAKDLPAEEAERLLGDLRPLFARHGALLSAGLRPPLFALAEGALHLPSGLEPADARRALGEECLIGCSAHSLEEAQAAAAGGADYVTLSPVFAPSSKAAFGPPLGLAGLRVAAHALPLPVVALGGITPARAGDCRAAGAAAIAVLGGIFNTKDPVSAFLSFLDQDHG